MRVSAAAERAGIPTVSIAATAFIEEAREIARYQGLAEIAIAQYPGHPMLDADDVVRSKTADVVLKNMLDALASPVTQSQKAAEPGRTDIVFRGTLGEVQDFFHENQWSDGLPVIPPTLEKVNEFMAFADRDPDEVIGVLPVENREATVWSVATNGVMAGCRPEYMPVLLAVVEAIAEREFRAGEGGSTPGWEPLIVVNGPIVKQLDFNSGPGVMRVGRQANTSIGRFLRMYMRNIAGIRIPPGATDKGSIAGSFNVVLAEDEDAVAELGWQPYSVDRGFDAGDNVVTVQSCCGISGPTYSAGDTPKDHLDIIAEVIGRRMMSMRVYLCAQHGKQDHLFLMSPGVAKVIAGGGWTKSDIRRYLYENCKVPARYPEGLARASGISNFSLCQCVEEGTAPKEYCESTDPDRLVPVFLSPESIHVVLAGDPGRNQTKGYMSNARQGASVSKQVKLPKNWPAGSRRSQGTVGFTDLDQSASPEAVR